MKNPIGRIATAAALVALFQSGASAQVVRGRLLDQATNTTVSGGFVRLVDSAGRRITATLSNASGVYQLAAPAPGTYTLRVERLGYANFQTRGIVLGSEIVTHDIVLPQTPIDLPAITGSADSRCDRRDKNAAAVSAIWEEIRKALSIESWTSQSGSVYFRIESTRQTVAANNRDRVIRGDIDTTAGSIKGSPFKSFAGDSLLSRGFIQLNERGEPEYFGPDAELIMSETFQESHCFHAVVDSRKPGLVGVAFEPNGMVKPFDIKGTLWIDKRSYELRSLEFSYNKLPVKAPLNTAGGNIHFARLPTGMWIISSWTLTAPIAPMPKQGVVNNMSVSTVLKVSQRVLEAFVNKQRVYESR